MDPVQKIVPITDTVRDGRRRVETIVRAALACIAARAESLPAWREVDAAGALARARCLDTLHADGARLPALAGVTLAVTGTAGQGEALVARLRAAGAIVVGTNSPQAASAAAVVADAHVPLAVCAWSATVDAALAHRLAIFRPSAATTAAATAETPALLARGLDDLACVHAALGAERPGVADAEADLPAACWRVGWLDESAAAGSDVVARIAHRLGAEAVAVSGASAAAALARFDCVLVPAGADDAPWRLIGAPCLGSPGLPGVLLVAAPGGDARLLDAALALEDEGILWQGCCG